MHYFPLTLPFLLMFALFIVFLVLFIEIGLLTYAYERIGIGRRHMFALLALSFLGSYINIPVYELSPHAVESGQVGSFGGMLYVIPEVANWPATIIAVNVGGAVIPTLLSFYLLVKNRLYFRGLAAVAIVTFCVHAVAYPVKGVGIAEPTFVPPLGLHHGRPPAVQGICSSPGLYCREPRDPFIGADLLNLGNIQGLGAPVASIGGAGTFDGIFLTGILSVLLVSLMTGRRNSSQRVAG
jgi:uncharacterized membrane protein